MQVILGAGGAISDSLCAALHASQLPVRLVSRRAEPSRFGSSVSADLVTGAGLPGVLKDAETAYLLVGLPYKTRYWQEHWPPMVRRIIDACAAQGTNLVFLDNIYMLSEASMPAMTETSPMQPSSRKGKIRAAVDQLILDAMAGGRIKACIARSADFYGYMSPNKSLLLDLVIRRMCAGKRPQWMYTTARKHAFSYTPDIGRALAILGQSDRAWGEIWNVPTAPALTLEAIIGLLNEELGTALEAQVMSEGLMKLLRLFIPALAEMKELKYQLTSDYVLDSSKFETAFTFRPTPMREGLRQVIAEIRQNG